MGKKVKSRSGKKCGLVVLLALLVLPAIASAQVGSFDNLSVTIGIGAAVPARWENFTENYKPAFYRVLNAEYDLGNGVSAYGAYDRAIFAGDDVENIDAVGWGVGMMYFFDFGKPGHFRGYAQIGGMANTIKGATTEWSFPAGLGVDYEFAEQASIRFGADLRTLSETDEIDAFLLKAVINIRPFKAK